MKTERRHESRTLSRRVFSISRQDATRNELEPALGEFVISGAGLVALRTNRLRALPRTHRDLDTLVIGTETGLLINESRKMVTTI
jgi:hypothetical protein